MNRKPKKTKRVMMGFDQNQGYDLFQTQKGKGGR